MLFSPDPLGERLTLLWHNHFTTSDRKVQSVAAMRRQNELLRELARAPFGELLNGALRDPALLTWLDAGTNRRGRPNENLALELMGSCSRSASAITPRRTSRKRHGHSPAARWSREPSGPSRAVTMMGKKRFWDAPAVGARPTW